MNEKAKAIMTLYNAKRITLKAVKKAVIDKVITAADYKIITGFEFA